VLLFANVPFCSVWQRCHQLALGLSEHTDVVYVDPNRSFLKARRRGWVPTTEPLPARLHVFSPPSVLPGARSIGLFNRLNYRLVASQLRSFLQRKGLRPSAAVATFPDQIDALTHFPGVPLVYDLMDEPDLFLRASQKPRYARMHSALLARASSLVVSARVLLDRHGSAVQRAVWISNGVREELFDHLRAATPIPVLANLPGPRIGYVGMISHWFDFAAVAAIAQRVPSGSVVLVGPTDVTPPKLPPNVVFTGPVPHDRLASVLAGFDVGLIPFIRSRAIDAVNPVKLYEYLAAGVPVLASDFEEIRQYRPLVRVYRDPAEAAAAAAQLIGPRTSAETEERRAFAWGHRWRAKAGAMAAEIRAAVAGAPAPGALWAA
jgi:glycosyltransferase involved in cell wall biosynthesis